MMVNIGYDCHLKISSIESILEPNSNPIKRVIKQARKENILYSCSRDQPTMSVIIMTNGHVYLSALSPHELTHSRLGKNK